MRLCSTLLLTLLFTLNCYAIESEQWITDVHYLASDDLEGRRTGTVGAERARAYIEQRFAQLTLTPLKGLESFRQTFSEPGRRKNLVHGINVVSAYSHADAPYILVTAHYDHLGRKGRRIFNGADDNASGVSAMLELALRTTKNSMQCNVMFLATDAEEHGLLGAKAFANTGVLESYRLFANLNLDMLSQPGGRHDLLVSGVRSHPAFEDLTSQIETDTSLPMINTDAGYRVGRYPVKGDRTKVSDHAVFAERGIPFLFLGVGRHNYYHTPRDTASRINEGFYGRVVDASWRFLKGLDGLCGKELQANHTD
ncbi:Peptidase family M28 [Marisediminitalea aggregata]|uniref:Peptidase family M28 n=1 Tax=Marisediminitalea aggregata TaxID=634436 RepID=A0A1M5RRF8_9ALTE|nr:M28 family peptidase [Marisediminitalea aggregata]SHH28826.1 Peptidase family M28 [Marisediminitalea aggregata]